MDIRTLRKLSTSYTPYALFREFNEIFGNISLLLSPWVLRLVRSENKPTNAEPAFRFLIQQAEKLNQK